MLPNEILNGRIVRAVQRIAGIQGDSPTPQLTPEISVNLEVPRGVEDLYLYGDRICSRFFEVVGDATHVAQVQLYNPTGSGVLVVVDGFHVAEVAGSTDLFLVRDVNAASLFATTVTGMNCDNRWLPSTASAQLRTAVDQNGAGIVLGYFQRGTTFYPFPYVITPGSWLTLTGNAVATTLLGTIRWREHPMPPLETRQA